MYRKMAALFAVFLFSFATIAEAQSGYKIGPEDIIVVQVMGHEELSVRARVKPDGTISLPLTGDIKVAGETIVSLPPKVEKLLVDKGLLRDPIVNVEVVNMVSQTVTVMGKITQPGRIALDQEMTVSGVITRAGGVRGDGATYVLLRRPSEPERRIEVADFNKGGDADPVVKAGDSLFVPDAEVFYVYGQVNAPGVYPIVPNMTLQMALARAGGPNAMGSDKRVRITRGEEEIKGKLDMKVQKDDVIVVKERIF